MKIPRLDMGKFLGGNATDRQRFADKLGGAFRQTGFVVVDNHGIPADLIERGYAEARKLFAVPEATLQKYETPDNGRQTGYTSLGVEHAKDQSPDEADIKQHWNVRRPLPPGHPRLTNPLYVRNLWPDAEAPGFRPVALEMFSALDDLSVEILIALEIHLDYPPGTLVEMVRDGETLMRILHYPPVEGTPKALRSGPHEDINLITLLIAGTQPGLEVKTRAGQWFPVNETPGSVVVNVGDMLQMFTNWELPSTTHRVVNPSNGATNVSRYSWPHFVHPRGEVVLHQESGYTAAQYLRYRLWEIGLIELDTEPLAPPARKAA